ncbi:MAG TPA: MFS transporter [Streptosporangiaceae bacterium]
MAFGLGSAACAAAPNLGALIAARAVQGLGAPALLPCSLALIVHQFPDPRARARALGAWGGMGSLGVALGPVLGGALIATVGWRAIFLVNVPVCALTGWLLIRYVSESEPDTTRRTDLPGLVLGVAELAGITAAFIEAGREGWLSPLPDALGAAGIVTAAAFIWWKERSPGGPGEPPCRALVRLAVAEHPAPGGLPRDVGDPPADQIPAAHGQTSMPGTGRQRPVPGTCRRSTGSGTTRRRCPRRRPRWRR